MEHAKTLILLGMDTPTGLCLTRELGEHGIRVIGVYGSRFSVGAASRYTFAKHQRAPKDKLIDQLLSLISHYKADAFLAVSENDIQWINQHRDHFSHIPLMFPDQLRMTQVLDKQRTYEHAEKCGVPIPRSYQIQSLEELRSLKDELSYPVVIKWPDPIAVISQLQQHKIPLIKADYADNFIQLERKMADYAQLGVFPLIQIYHKGHGLGQFFLIHKGKVIQRFQHKRIHEWPPEGGYSTYCESLDINQHADLFAKSEALLQSLEWEGVAMVEYRYDDHTNQAVLMEVNGRFWGSFPLAYHSGAQLARLYFETVTNTPSSLPPSPKAGVQCRFMIPEVKRLVRVLLQPNKIQDKQYINTPWKDLGRFLWAFVRPNSKYFVFQFKDPRPLLMDLWGIVRSRF
jgi:predicted ATP-grasp superfamily ATP-dependent carboligase